MALWNTFNWSDGTLWADANGLTSGYTTQIDRSAYHVSLKLTHTNETYPGSLASFVIQSISAEVGVRPQLPDSFEAFIDRNETTQRISARITHTANVGIQLTTEDDDPITTEAGDPLLADPAQPFGIDHIHILANPRSRQQPTR